MRKLNSHISLKTSVPMILSLIIVVVIVLEVAAAYAFWFRSLEVESAQPSGESIVRVNLPGYRRVIQFLDSLIAFQPEERDLEPNPFRYR